MKIKTYSSNRYSFYLSNIASLDVLSWYWLKRGGASTVMMKPGLKCFFVTRNVDRKSHCWTKGGNLNLRSFMLRNFTTFNIIGSAAKYHDKSLKLEQNHFSHSTWNAVEHHLFSIFSSYINTLLQKIRIDLE